MDQTTSRVDVAHLAAFDVDGALREAAERVNDANRRSFLRGAGIFAGALTISAYLPRAARAQGGLPKGDVDILNYALTLEYLETAFYEEANDKGALSGQYARFSKAGVLEDHRGLREGRLRLGGALEVEARLLDRLVAAGRAATAGGSSGRDGSAGGASRCGSWCSTSGAAG